MNHPARLLVVDDNPVVLLALSELMRKAGFEVFSGRNGEETVRLARQERPELILLDVVLPDIDGVELCCRISGLQSQARILNENYRQNKHLKNGGIILTISGDSQIPALRLRYLFWQ